MNEINLKSDLVKVRKVLKAKLAELKRSERLREEVYLPITSKLQNIAQKLYTDQLPDQSSEQKEEPKDEPKTPNKQTSFKRLKRKLEPSFLADEEVFSSKAIEQKEEEEETQENEEDELTRYLEESKEFMQSFSESQEVVHWLNALPPLPRQYIGDMIKDTENKFDFRYGIRFDDNTLKIGNGKFSIDPENGNVIITDTSENSVTYTATPGLFELLFKKQPSGFSAADQKNYLDIVRRTSAHRRNYDPEEQIAGNSSHKYREIIGKLAIERAIPPRPRSSSLKKRGGGGVMMKKLTNNPVDYVFWDDINELVDRLRLLVSSQTAGHTGHINEIQSILEELREAGVIE